MALFVIRAADVLPLSRSSIMHYSVAAWPYLKRDHQPIGRSYRVNRFVVSDEQNDASWRS